MEADVTKSAGDLGLARPCKTKGGVPRGSWLGSD